MIRGAHVLANEAHKLEGRPQGNWWQALQGSRVSCCRVQGTVQHHGVDMKDGDMETRTQLAASPTWQDECASSWPNAGTLATSLACIGQARWRVRLLRLRSG